MNLTKLTLPLAISTGAVGLTLGSTANGMSTPLNYIISISQDCNWTNNSGGPFTLIGNYQVSDSKEQLISGDELKLQHRYEALEKSFKKHNNKFPASADKYFNLLAKYLCIIPFTDNLASFNEYDASIDFRLSLPHDISLNVSYFIEEIDNNVVFTIHHNKRLLVSDELPMDRLVSMLNEIIKELPKGNV
nr:hypothetical protein [Odoribacter splanchnicus]